MASFQQQQQQNHKAYEEKGSIAYQRNETNQQKMSRGSSDIGLTRQRL